MSRCLVSQEPMGTRVPVHSDPSFDPNSGVSHSHYVPDLGIPREVRSGLVFG